jgi:CheY-like chemotaxis protein/anti-sigma regulatory factor (Ser/Thr protein kinase)
MAVLPIPRWQMARAAASARRKNVLVADDDRATRFAIATTLRKSGYRVDEANDGNDAVNKITAGSFDLVFMDIWMPGISGLEVLGKLRKCDSHPKVVVMTSDATPQTLLQAIRERAYEYVNKPFRPGEAVEIAARVLGADASPPIEVISAQPHWVELLIPCTRDAAERVQSFLMKLESELPEALRSSIGMAFRELLSNAVEWGGKLDPNRKVRIACVRTPNIIMYRIADPGPGFDPAKLPHAAVGQPADNPMAHIAVRDELGIRAGGFGLMMTKALADELIYNEARNEVIFVKYLAADQAKLQAM